MTKKDESGIITEWWAYRGCLIPPLAVLAGAAIFALLATLLGDSSLKGHEPTFIAVQGYPFPNRMSLDATFGILHLVLWWILAICLLWLVALIGSGAAIYIVHRSLKELPNARRVGFWLMAFIIGLLIAKLVVLMQNGIPIFPLQDLSKKFVSLATGMETTLNWTNVVVIVAIVEVILCAGMIMMPARDESEYNARMKSLNGLLLVGATIIVVWVFYLRVLYGFIATTLVAEQQKHAMAIAPTISLVIGGMASILLVLMYMSAFFWLQARYDLKTEHRNTENQLATEDMPESPKTLFFRTWPRVFMLISPILPGLFEVFFDFFK